MCLQSIQPKITAPETEFMAMFDSPVARKLVNFRR